jgi:hypothetical protein
MELLILASFSIAVVHSLAPDHYFPFVAIGRLRDWSIGKTLIFSTLAGTLHVANSVVVGAVLIYGMDLLGVARFIEEVSPILLVLIGLAYALMSSVREHKHIHSSSAIMILLLIGLSPCVPLIPLMLASSNSFELTAVVITFALATLGTVLTLTFLSYGVFKPPRLHGREDVVAGLIIAIVGLITHLVKIAGEIIGGGDLSKNIGREWRVCGRG